MEKALLVQERVLHLSRAPDMGSEDLRGLFMKMVFGLGNPVDGVTW